jgi:cellulose biosynthesis protein BcsQ
VLEVMHEKNLPVFDIQIGRTVRFAEAALAGESILSYAHLNPAAQAYRQLAEVVDIGYPLIGIEGLATL